MLLLTFNEWFGPTRGNEDKVPVLENQSAFVTEMTLPEALLRLDAYKQIHNTKYCSSAIEYTLLSVVTIESLDSVISDKFGITLIDDLPITLGEIP